MALVLSFIHVVIVHINFHQPSHSSCYRAYHHRRPGLCHSPIPQSCRHAGPMASLSALFCLPLDKAVALAPYTHSGAPQQSQAVCCHLKRLRVLLNANQSGCLLMLRLRMLAQEPGRACPFRWHLTSPNCCGLRLIYQGLKKIKQHSGDTVGWPASQQVWKHPLQRFRRRRPSSYYTEGNIC